MRATARRRPGARRPGAGVPRAGATRPAAALAAAILALGVVAAAPGARGQTPAPDTLRVTAAVSPAVVGVGERVRVRFAVPRPDTTARLVAPPAPVAFGDLDVVASEPAPAGPDSLGWRLEVALFRPGDHELGAIPFALESAGGTRPVRLAPYTVSVESSLPDTLAGAGLRDIAAPVDLPPRWRRGAVLLAVLVAAALAVAAVLWRRRPRAVEPVRAARPAIPPEAEARRALAALERDALPARGLMKEHYARLSLILRAYLERRTPLPAVESTTDEIRSALARSGWIPSGRAGELLDLFDEADLVKFARFDPGREAAERALARGRGWFESVAPALAGPAEPAAAAPAEEAG